MIARECVAGTNQYDAMIDAYAGAPGWDELPSTPPMELRAAGRYVGPRDRLTYLDLHSYLDAISGRVKP